MEGDVMSAADKVKEADWRLFCVFAIFSWADMRSAYSLSIN